MVRRSGELGTGVARVRRRLGDRRSDRAGRRVRGGVLAAHAARCVAGAEPSGDPNESVVLFNIVATPGALLRYWSKGQLGGPLIGQLARATVPGVVIGALIRIYLVPGGQVFRLIAAGVLLPLGVWLRWRTAAGPSHRPPRSLSPHAISALALVVGVVGGIYGIGGGSLLGPILVGAGMPVAVVTPAALASTFLTSLLGVATYAPLAVSGPATPHA
jgi:uncharacterized membrane protein YfcA